MEQIYQHLESILGLNITATQLGFSQMFCRTVVIFISMLIMMRIAGRRFIAQRKPEVFLVKVEQGVQTMRIQVT